MNAQRQLGINGSSLAKSTEKLSSGQRINRAGDDAAGLAISEKMRGQIRGLNQASSNSQDGISLIQTAEGALDEVHNMLQRMRELAVKAGNQTYTTKDRQNIQSEINQLAAEIDAISTRSEFNTKKLLNGSFSNMQFQVGANSGQTIKLSVSNMSMAALLGSAGATGVGKPKGSLTTNQIKGTSALYSAISVLTASGASASATGTSALSYINSAINLVSAQRSQLGAVQNRLEHTIKNLDNSSENLQAAESRIRDVDMAKEMLQFTKSNILSQASQSMLAQANQAPNQVLSLLG